MRPSVVATAREDLVASLDRLDQLFDHAQLHAIRQCGAPSCSPFGACGVRVAATDANATARSVFACCALERAAAPSRVARVQRQPPGAPTVHSSFPSLNCFRAGRTKICPTAAAVAMGATRVASCGATQLRPHTSPCAAETPRGPRLCVLLRLEHRATRCARPGQLVPAPGPVKISPITRSSIAQIVTLNSSPRDGRLRASPTSQGLVRGDALAYPLVCQIGQPLAHRRTTRAAPSPIASTQRRSPSRTTGPGDNHRTPTIQRLSTREQPCGQQAVYLSDHLVRAPQGERQRAALPARPRSARPTVSRSGRSPSHLADHHDRPPPMHRARSRWGLCAVAMLRPRDGNEPRPQPTGRPAAACGRPARTPPTSRHANASDVRVATPSGSEPAGQARRRGRGHSRDELAVARPASQ